MAHIRDPCNTLSVTGDRACSSAPGAPQRAIDMPSGLLCPARASPRVSGPPVPSGARPLAQVAQALANAAARHGGAALAPGSAPASLGGAPRREASFGARRGGRAICVTVVFQGCGGVACFGALRLRGGLLGGASFGGGGLGEAARVKGIGL